MAYRLPKRRDPSGGVLALQDAAYGSTAWAFLWKSASGAPRVASARLEDRTPDTLVHPRLILPAGTLRELMNHGFKGWRRDYLKLRDSVRTAGDLLDVLPRLAALLQAHHAAKQGLGPAGVSRIGKFTTRIRRFADQQEIAWLPIHVMQKQGTVPGEIAIGMS